MGRSLSSIDLRVVGGVFGEISRSWWFEPNDVGALALYLIHNYSPGQNHASLMAIAEPFAREWFRRGLGRFDVLAPEDRIVLNSSDEVGCGAPFRHISGVGVRDRRPREMI
jgi:hypothetical protein